MMWRALAHDMLISHVQVVSLLIPLIAGNLFSKLSLWLSFVGNLRTISLSKILVHFEIVSMHFD